MGLFRYNGKVRMLTRLNPNPQARCMGLFRWRESRTPLHGLVSPKRDPTGMPRSILTSVICHLASAPWARFAGFRITPNNAALISDI